MNKNQKKKIIGNILMTDNDHAKAIKVRRESAEVAFNDFKHEIEAIWELDTMEAINNLEHYTNRLDYWLYELKMRAE